MYKSKTEKGITLIALIITIVVLLIIAVVTVGAVKESDIIAHAETAKSEYSVAQEKENLQLAISEAILAGKGNATTANLDTSLKEIFKDDIEIDTTSSENFVKVKIKSSDREWKVYLNGKIEEDSIGGGNIPDPTPIIPEEVQYTRYTGVTNSQMYMELRDDGTVTANLGGGEASADYEYEDGKLKMFQGGNLVMEFYYAKVGTNNIIYTLEKIMDKDDPNKEESEYMNVFLTSNGTEGVIPSDGRYVGACNSDHYGNEQIKEIIINNGRFIDKLAGIPLNPEGDAILFNGIIFRTYEGEYTLYSQYKISADGTTVTEYDGSFAYTKVEE